jgi:aminopeptidase N
MTALIPAFRALCLQLPGEDDMAQTIHAMGRIPIRPDPQRPARDDRGAGIRLGDRIVASFTMELDDNACPSPHRPRRPGGVR